MVVATVAAFLWIHSYGETLVAPAAAAPAVSEAPAAAAPAVGVNVLLRVLVALAAVIVLGQALGRACAWIGQPPVIGEVLAGILLGPSLLGERVSALALPAEVAPYLGLIAQFGVVLYMFLVGLELNLGLLRHRAHSLVATAHASILVPFVLGAALAIYLYPRFSSSAVPFTSFALFVGVALSITAFPVLARILTDRGLSRTELGVVALSCAATVDVTAWCLLAFVVGVARAEVGAALQVALWTLAFIAFMVVAVRPLWDRLAARWEGQPLSRGRVALVFVALLVSALVTEAIGIHAIFGAFLLGAVIPHESNVSRSFVRQLEHLVTVLLLPAFFAFTGMRTRIDLLAEPSHWLVCGLIVLVATVGKFGGTIVAARLTGLAWRDAAALGALMNTRGLMELIVLNVGLDLGVISPTLFAMMVLMALATTMATAPVLKLLGLDGGENVSEKDAPPVPSPGTG
jgi:Kef-type K+ transport system membrane component KefB